MTIGHVPAQARSVLPSTGHIAGIVNHGQAEGTMHDRRDRYPDGAPVAGGRHPPRRLVVGGLDPLEFGSRDP